MKDTLHLWGANCPSDQINAFSANVAALLSNGMSAIVVVKSIELAKTISKYIQPNISTSNFEKLKFVDQYTMASHYAKNGQGADYEGPFMEINQ